ncbi:hypothetical protein P4054_14760 [Pseudomonas aeruginosa]|nr:hypothetical protein [Pseudomonas aeruginosa]
MDCLGETSASRQLRRYWQTLRAAGQERHVALRRLVEELLEENLQPALSGRQARLKAAGHSPLERRCQSAVRSRRTSTGGSPP